ncbi:MAG: hypothetical protein ACRDYA_07150 [Egibacteraceae bacterium]
MILGGLTMILLSLLLFWLPLLGPLIAGFAGGWIIRRPGLAMAVTLLPEIMLGLVIWIVLTVFDLPLFGALAGVTIFLVIAFQGIPLLVGALIGGAVAD